eukprot:gene16606-biopygen8269
MGRSMPVILPPAGVPGWGAVLPRAPRHCKKQRFFRWRRWIRGLSLSTGKSLNQQSVYNNPCNGLMCDGQRPHVHQNAMKLSTTCIKSTLHATNVRRSTAEGQR